MGPTVGLRVFGEQKILLNIPATQPSSPQHKYYTDYSMLAITQNIHPVYLYFRHAEGQLVEALLYKPESRGFDSRWCHWNFSLT